MAGASVPIARVIRRRDLVPLLAVALACAALALLPGTAGAQTPLEITASGVLTTGQGTIVNVRSTGTAVRDYRCLPVDHLTLNGNVVPLVAMCLRTGNAPNAIYFFFAGDSKTAWETHAGNNLKVSQIEFVNSTNSVLFRAVISPPDDSFGTSGGSERLRIEGSSHLITNSHGFRYTSIEVGSVSAVTGTGRLRLTFTGDVSAFASEANSAIPGPPEIESATRSSDQRAATIRWYLLGKAVEYQIEREQAITIEAQQTATTQYGNSTRFLVASTVWGLSEYTDGTIESRYTYRYRVRARRGVNKWGPWSGYVISGSDTSVNLEAPANLEVSRAEDNASVEISWLPPAGDFDAYAVQRQELVVVEGSTIFANPITLADDLGADTLTYTDSSILPGRTYEYRIAALQDGKVGDYSEWFRVSPFNTSLGDAPRNFRLGLNRKLDDRRELWMVWDEVEGVDDYEVEILTFNGVGDGHASERRVITDPAYFHTAYGRVELRVRARKKDEALCGSGANDRCHTEWTGGYPVQFTPAVQQQEGLPTPMPDASIDEFQEDVDQLLNTTLDQSGVDVDPSIAVQFAVLAGTAVLAVVCVVAGWKRGMRPLGVGMGFSVSVISLYLGYRLLGIPAAWPIGAQTIIAIPGIIAFARQLGAFR